jgi:pimeloyl-ACP methyl ester carboxylesterase
MIRERTIETAGRRIAWIEAGAGWPVILLHAFPFNADMWRLQLANVPGGWRFIAPDLRGFGQTPLHRHDANPDEAAVALTLDDYATDVGCLMDGLELDTAVIGGLSMGGYVVFALFRQAPSRFSGMLLADTRPQADTADARRGRTGLRQILAQRGPSGVADEMLPKLLSERTLQERPTIVEHARQIVEANQPRAIDAAIGAMMTRPDSTGDLPRIACATLVMVGADDTVTPPSDAEAMQREIPRSTLTVIPDAGHLSNLEQPDAFSKGLRDFLFAHL